MIVDFSLFVLHCITTWMKSYHAHCCANCIAGSKGRHVGLPRRQQKARLTVERDCSRRAEV